LVITKGGVWWTSDDKSSGVIVKGQEAEDEIFREAEKLGLDIRESSKPFTILGAINEQEESSRIASQNKTMSFSFFNDTETPLESSFVPTSQTVIDKDEESTSPIEPVDWSDISFTARQFCRSKYVSFYQSITIE
jgi:hypothetical protein